MKITIAALAKKYGIFPIKSLGQNFIYDMSLCEKIASTANIKADDYIIEIGPGTAGLTRAILNSGPKQLIVIEKDERCINLLNEVKEFYPNLSIINIDAKKISFQEILSQFSLPQNLKFKIISNLPYNISTALIISYLKKSEYINSMHVMVQKEVADRIRSKENRKEYGRLSVISQLMSDIHKEFDVTPESFYPRPKVNSSVISLYPKKEPLDSNILDNLEKITRYAFGMRRKMLQSSLKPLELNKYSHEIDLSKRAENLSPEIYINLAKMLL